MGARAMSGAIQEGGGDPGGAGEGASATAAKRMVQAVQQFVAMLQIQQVRGGGPAAHCAGHPACSAVLCQSGMRRLGLPQRDLAARRRLSVPNRLARKRHCAICWHRLHRLFFRVLFLPARCCCCNFVL